MATGGVVRSSAAQESKQKYFLTRNAIVNHFRREEDRAKLLELLEKDQKHISDLLHAASVVHAFYYLGIRTRDTTELQNIAVQDHQKVEDMEKRELLSEINLLVGNSIRTELEIFLKAYRLGSKIAETLQGRKKNEEELLEHLREEVEEDLIKLLREYPAVYFYDYVGDLAGFSEKVEADILREASEMRPIGQEIEVALASEYDDKYIELSKIRRVQEQMQEKFEFSSFKELEVEAIPLKMIITAIMLKNVDVFPISERAIQAFIDANNVAINLFEFLQTTEKELTSIQELETKVKKRIIEEIGKACSRGPNYFIYFMQNFWRKTFPETIATLSMYGITDIPAFAHVFPLSVEKIQKQMRLYSITELDLKQLANITNNPLIMVQKELEVYKQRKVKEGHTPEAMYSLNLEKITEPSSSFEAEATKIVFHNVKVSQEDVRKLLKKTQIVKEKFLPSSNMANIDELILCLAKGNILENLAKDVYFNLIGDICRQLGRVLEMYLKIKDDKSKFLLALKRIFETETVATEDWVAVKLEELIIERLVRRQKELQNLLGTNNDPYLVNGFIFARLVDKSLKDAIQTFDKEDSPLYADIAAAKLPKELLSPISYVLSFDVLKRFQSHERRRKLKVEEAFDRKEEKQEKFKREMREKQDVSTFDWIERKISTSLMRVSSKGINPSQLYWTDKDTRMVSDAIKHHSEMKNFKICPKCGIELPAKEQCSDGTPAKIANVVELFTNFYLFAMKKIQTLWPKMRVPEYEEVLKTIILEDAMDILGSRLGKVARLEDLETILEGDRVELSQRITKRIGKILDNAVYKKFRETQRTD
ncbi:MAG: hypothetical protein RBG13Loki_0273 [Promethearchaeota archaeon CR_4]|nr:MAG: hypothetical protein RBG13Loki_0273 [Candidatus Lokiarchaeota archaeon CR_4]